MFSIIAYDGNVEHIYSLMNSEKNKIVKYIESNHYKSYDMVQCKWKTN